MSLIRSRTAVLLFSLPAALEAARKGLTGQRAARNRALWENMHQLTTAKVRASGLDCVSSLSLVANPDYSASFGSQLQVAVTATLAQGYKHVIVIGNDCPDLRVSDLRAAARTLAQGSLPVGYDRRGGVFLFGVDQRFLSVDSLRETASFESLPWQSRELGTALTAHLHQAFGAVVSLSAVRADWNERADLQAGDWLAGAFAGLAQQVWSLAARATTVFQTAFLSLQVFSHRAHSLRAPPVAA
jgi:glycosyltransferase A (GT-A) superfamily protein (DUF2064 family)